MGGARCWLAGFLLALFVLDAAATEYPSEWRARELLGTSRTGSTVTGNYEFRRSSSTSTLPTLYRSEQVALQRATLATVARRGLSLARLGAGGPWGAAALLAVEGAGWAWNQTEEYYETGGEVVPIDPAEGQCWRLSIAVIDYDACAATPEGHFGVDDGTGVAYRYEENLANSVYIKFQRHAGGSDYHYSSALVDVTSLSQDVQLVDGYTPSEPVTDDQLLDELLPAIDPSRWEGIMEDGQGRPFRYPEVRDMEWELTQNDPANSAESLPEDAPSTWAPSDDPAGSDSSAPEETEFPGFCAWAGVVCDWIDWTQEPPPDEEPPPLPTEEVDVSDGLNAWDSGLGSGACPAPMSIALGPFGGPVDIPYDPFCDLATAIRPMVIAAGMLIGLFIVVRRV